MNLPGRKMLLPLALVFTVAALAVTSLPNTTLRAATLASDTQRDTQRDAELRRIHVHFDSVLAELSPRSVSHLTQKQQSNRAALLQTLRGYSARSEFPHNYDFATPTPYFIDRKTGTLCAVAYLLESTGRRSLVDRVARTNNNVWVAQLKGDAPFEAWLNENGITLDEAARIQVPYENSVSGTEVVLVGAGIFVPLATTLGVSTWNALGNANGHSRAGAYVGLVSGFATTGMGLFISHQNAGARGVRTVAYSFSAVGLLGSAIATRSLMHRGRYLAARTEAENAKRGGVQTSISPIIPMGKDGGTGLSMSIKF